MKINTITVDRNSPIGLFDSGIGGLGIAKEIHTLLPHENLVYLADTDNCPYGTKTTTEVIRISQNNTKRLIEDYACKLIVVACNTATSLAIERLRIKFPLVPIIGVVPVIKTAVKYSKIGSIAVMSTPNTIHSRIYKELIDTFASNITVISIPCKGLAHAIENGENASKIEKMVRGYMHPFLNSKFDVVALGCTHYTLIKPIIQKVVGDDILLLDSNKAVARHVQRVLQTERMQSIRGNGKVTYLGIDISKKHFYR